MFTCVSGGDKISLVLLFALYNFCCLIAFVIDSFNVAYLLDVLCQLKCQLNYFNDT